MEKKHSAFCNKLITENLLQLGYPKPQYDPIRLEDVLDWCEDHGFCWAWIDPVGNPDSESHVLWVKKASIGCYERFDLATWREARLAIVETCVGAMLKERREAAEAAEKEAAEKEAAEKEAVA